MFVSFLKSFDQRWNAALPACQLATEVEDLVVFLPECRGLFLGRALQTAFQTISLCDRDFQVAANVLQLPLQCVAPGERFL